MGERATVRELHLYFRETDFSLHCYAMHDLKSFLCAVTECGISSISVSCSWRHGIFSRSQYKQKRRSRPRRQCPRCGTLSGGVSLRLRRCTHIFANDCSQQQSFLRLLRRPCFAACGNRKHLYNKGLLTSFSRQTSLSCFNEWISSREYIDLWYSM